MAGSVAPVTPPKAAPLAQTFPKWFQRPPRPKPAPGAPSAPSTAAPSAPSAPAAAAGKAKANARRRSNRGPSQEWREGNRFRAFGELKEQEAQGQQRNAALAQQEVVQNQRNAFQETLQRQKANYEAASQQLQEKMNQDLTDAKVTYQENLQKQKAYYEQLLADQSKDLQELKEAKTHYNENMQKQRAYYEKKISDLDYMLSEYQKKKKQKDMECQQLQEKLTKAERCYLKQLQQKDMELQKQQEKLQKTEMCYFKLLEEAKRVKDEDTEPPSSPTSPANKKILGAQAARPKAGPGSDCTAIVL